MSLAGMHVPDVAMVMLTLAAIYATRSSQTPVPGPILLAANLPASTTSNSPRSAVNITCGRCRQNGHNGEWNFDSYGSRHHCLQCL